MVYLNHVLAWRCRLVYQKQSGLKKDDIERWLLPLCAARYGQA